MYLLQNIDVLDIINYNVDLTFDDYSSFENTLDKINDCIDEYNKEYNTNIENIFQENLKVDNIDCEDFKMWDLFEELEIDGNTIEAWFDLVDKMDGRTQDLSENVIKAMWLIKEHGFNLNGLICQDFNNIRMLKCTKGDYAREWYNDNYNIPFSLECHIDWDSLGDELDITEFVHEGDTYTFEDNFRKIYGIF
jgi:hypothetical protein